MTEIRDWLLIGVPVAILTYLFPLTFAYMVWGRVTGLPALYNTIIPFTPVLLAFFAVFSLRILSDQYEADRQASFGYNQADIDEALKSAAQSINDAGSVSVDGTTIPAYAAYWPNQKVFSIIFRMNFDSAQIPSGALFDIQWELARILPCSSLSRSEKMILAHASLRAIYVDNNNQVIQTSNLPRGYCQ